MAAHHRPTQRSRRCTRPSAGRYLHRCNLWTRWAHASDALQTLRQRTGHCLRQRPRSDRSCPTNSRPPFVDTARRICALGRLATCIGRWRVDGLGHQLAASRQPGARIFISTRRPFGYAHGHHAWTERARVVGRSRHSTHSGGDT